MNNPCAVCGCPIPIDCECIYLDLERGLCVCCLCEPQLKRLMRVAKLHPSNSHNWMGFRLDEAPEAPLDEVRELLSELSVGDSLTIRVEKLPLSEVLCWEEHQGW